MKFRILPSAFRDLDGIETWVTEHFGSSYAANTEAQLLSTFDLLADFPQMGRIRPDVLMLTLAQFATSC